MSDSLPKVSISRLRLEGAARKDEIIKLRQAGQSVGFFLATDYEEDISAELEDKTFDQARALFNLPPPSLRRIALDRSLDPSNRGYEGLGAQSLDPGLRQELVTLITRGGARKTATPILMSSSRIRVRLGPMPTIKQ